MTTQQRFKQYMKIIEPCDRESWIFATLANMSDEMDRIKLEISKLKAHNTRQKNKKP